MARSSADVQHLPRLAERLAHLYSVRPKGAVHQWREDPSRELSVDPGS
jgi:hypothetical protein